MPLVDGAGSTRLIRAFEKEENPPLSQQAKSYGRIPIIAVSASLSEPSIEGYLETGFDGWILKPIDFSRLEAIMAATQDQQIRESLLYGNESWEKGGWFKVKARGDDEGDESDCETPQQKDSRKSNDDTPRKRPSTETDCETPQQKDSRKSDDDTFFRRDSVWSDCETPQPNISKESYGDTPQ